MHQSRPLRTAQMVSGEIAHRVEHSEATNFATSHEALVEERFQEADIRIRHPFRGIERPTSAEHRQRAEQLLLVRAQQVERPLDRCPKRSVSRLDVSPGPEKVESAAKALEKLIYGH